MSASGAYKSRAEMITRPTDTPVILTDASPSHALNLRQNTCSSPRWFAHVRIKKGKKIVYYDEKKSQCRVERALPYKSVADMHMNTL